MRALKGHGAAIIGEVEFVSWRQLASHHPRMEAEISYIPNRANDKESSGARQASVKECVFA